MVRVGFPYPCPAPPRTSLPITSSSFFSDESSEVFSRHWKDFNCFQPSSHWIAGGYIYQSWGEKNENGWFGSPGGPRCWTDASLQRWLRLQCLWGLWRALSPKYCGGQICMEMERRSYQEEFKCAKQVRFHLNSPGLEDWMNWWKYSFLWSREKNF